LPGKLAVNGSPLAQRRDVKAAGRSTLEWELHGDRRPGARGTTRPLVRAATGVGDSERPG